MNWKDASCNNFSQYLTPDQTQSFLTHTPLPLTHTQPRLDRETAIKRWLNTDKSNDLFNMLNEAFLMLPETKVEPGINYYYSNLVKALASGEASDIDALTKRGKVYNWRA